MYTLTLLYTIFEGLRGRLRLSTHSEFNLSWGVESQSGLSPGTRDSTPSSALFKWVERKVSRLSPIQSSVISRGWVPFGVESQSGLSPFGVESQSGLSPFEVQSHSGFSPIRGSVPFGVGSIWGSVPFGVQSIRGSVHSGLSPVRGWVHSRFSPFEVESF